MIGVSIHAPRAGRDGDWAVVFVLAAAFQSTRPARGATESAASMQTVHIGFQSTRPARGATSVVNQSSQSELFQSTRPARGATEQSTGERLGVVVSIHAPRAGRDGAFDSAIPIAMKFQSTRPARGATDSGSGYDSSFMVSIHAPRAGRDNDRLRRHNGFPVSIHAPRAGRDMSVRNMYDKYLVSIHAPRAGRDAPPLLPPLCPKSFNPRAPRGARHRRNAKYMFHDMFQSTRPARGATRQARRRCALHLCFNPRAPRGARPGLAVKAPDTINVSIHAPRAGRDHRLARCRAAAGCFNPRAPRGARRQISTSLTRWRLFQSTRPARGATANPLARENLAGVSIHAPRAGRDIALLVAALLQVVSIHAPRAGRDQTQRYPAQSRACFNPRAPRGARRIQLEYVEADGVFQSTRPARGATDALPWPGVHDTGFQSTRPARGATLYGGRRLSRLPSFQSTRPARGATCEMVVSGVSADVSIHAPRAGRDGSTIAALVSVF